MHQSHYLFDATLQSLILHSILFKFNVPSQKSDKISVLTREKNKISMLDKKSVLTRQKFKRNIFGKIDLLNSY